MGALLWQRKFKDFKDFLQGYSSKEFLIFLFFLAMSAAFWALSALNDTYEREFAVRLETVGVPREVVITKPLPDTVRVTLRDKGFMLVRYYCMGECRRPLTLDFAGHVDGKGRGSVTAAELQKALAVRLEETTAIVSVKADHWDFRYNHGKRKRVPLRLDGEIRAAENHCVIQTRLTPDSVTVYAADEVLDTIRAVYTEPLTMLGLADSKTTAVRLKPIADAKTEPATAKLEVSVEQLTEVTVVVPVQPANTPAGVMLKTFPARVNVTAAVGVGRSRTITSEQFSVVADYNDLPKDNSGKLRLKVLLRPSGVVKATIKEELVDYLTER